MKSIEIKNSLKAMKGVHERATGEPIRVTDQGKVVAYILPASQYDGEDLKFLTAPAFWEMMRESCKSDEGISLEEAMRDLEAREARENRRGRRVARSTGGVRRRIAASKAKSYK